MDNEPEPTNAPPMSDKVGQRRTPADIVRQSPTISEQAREGHTLTTKEATDIFERAGFPRSQRSIERYCKSGELDSVVDPDEERYYITRVSIDRVIGKLREIKARHTQTVVHEPYTLGPDDVGQSQPSSGDGGNTAEYEADPAKHIKELEFKLRDAEIGSRAKDLHIGRMNAERDRFLQQLIESSRQLGILETKLRQLEAPKQSTASSVEPVVESEAVLDDNGESQ